MITFFIYKSMYAPQEADMYLAQFRKQMLETKNAEDRAKIAIACPTPEKFGQVTKLSEEKVNAIKAFAKKHKIPWQVVVMTFGIDLHTKVHLVIGYGFPSYVKAFLRRANIPTCDIADEANFEEIKNATFCETPMDLAKKIVRAMPNRVSTEVLEYNDESKSYHFVEKAIASL